MTIVDVVERVNIHEREAFEKAIAKLPAGDRPLVPHNLYLASWWVRTNYTVPETSTFRVRILLPNGDDYAESAPTFAIPLENHTGFRARMQIPGIPWAGIGLYWFLVEEQVAEENWTAVTRIPLEVIFVGSPPEPAIASQSVPARTKGKTKKKMVRKKRT